MEELEPLIHSGRHPTADSVLPIRSIDRQLLTKLEGAPKAVTIAIAPVLVGEDTGAVTVPLPSYSNSFSQ